MTVRRNTPTCVLENGKIVTYERDLYFKKIGVQTIIRIRLVDYEHIPTTGFLAHFNLARTEHVVGERYALPKILEHGFYDQKTGEDKPPLLSFENIYFGTCIDLVHEISYSDVTPAMFEHSMTHIKSVLQLQQAMLDRYSKSRTTLTHEEILAMPISWTLLELEPRTTPQI